MLNNQIQNEQVKILNQTSIMIDKIFYFVNKSNPNKNYENDFGMQICCFNKKYLRFQINFYIFDLNIKNNKSFKLTILNKKDKDDKEFIRVFLSYPLRTPMRFSHNEYLNQNIENCFYTITETILEQLKKLKIIE